MDFHEFPSTTGKSGIRPQSSVRADAGQALLKLLNKTVSLDDLIALTWPGANGDARADMRGIVALYVPGRARPRPGRDTEAKHVHLRFDLCAEV